MVGPAPAPALMDRSAARKQDLVAEVGGVGRGRERSCVRNHRAFTAAPLRPTRLDRWEGHPEAPGALLDVIHRGVCCERC